MRLVEARKCAKTASDVLQAMINVKLKLMPETIIKQDLRQLYLLLSRNL